MAAIPPGEDCKTPQRGQVKDMEKPEGPAAVQDSSALQSEWRDRQIHQQPWNKTEFKDSDRRESFIRLQDMLINEAQREDLSLEEGQPPATQMRFEEDNVM